MRSYIFMAALLLVASVANAADWTDNGDGTFSMTVTYTVTSAEKTRADRCLEDFNQTYFYSGQEKDASDWLKALFEGFASTRDARNVGGTIDKLWRRFIRKYVNRQAIRSSDDRGDAAAMAATVPAPVAAP